MRTRLTLAIAFIVTTGHLAGCSSSNQDNDEGRLLGGQGGGGSGSSGGGSGGTAAGSSAAGGGATSSGGSSGGGAVIVSTLGGPCTSDVGCAAGLSCLAPASTELGGSPAGGLCTATCADHQACDALSTGAWCVNFGSTGYCLEGCLPDSDTTKCHDRLDVVCQMLQSIPGTVACTGPADCETGTLCVDGTCATPLTGCVPLCGSDADCSPGLFCDYRSGLCLATEPAGKDFNEACDPGPTADPEECRGFCSESYDDPSVGACSGFCNLSHPFACGYTGQGVANAACLFGTVLAGETPETSDLGVCGQLCDCNSDCTLADELCRPWDAMVVADYEALFQRDGYCVPIVAGSGFTAADSLDCGMGTGGAGSVPAAGGAGGAP